MSAPAFAPVAPALTGPQKAAILVMYLDRDAARALLRGLTDDEIARVGDAIAATGPTDEGIVEEVVADFVDQLRAVTVLPTTGRDFARNVLPELLDEDRRVRLQSALRRHGAGDFEAFVRTRPARAVASVLAEEHPQVRAVALLRMGPENAARVLACFEPDEQADLTVRMARAESVAGELAEDVETAIRSALAGLDDALPVGGVERTARILGRMPRERNAQVLRGVRGREQSLADDLQRRLVTFEQLAGLDARAIQSLLRTVDRADLVAALKPAPAEIRAAWLGNMSSRAARDLMEELELGGPVRRLQAREAQDRIVAIARRLADEGVLDLDGDLPEPA